MVIDKTMGDNYKYFWELPFISFYKLLSKSKSWIGYRYYYYYFDMTLKH